MPRPKRLPETVAPIGFRRGPDNLPDIGPDDLVIVVPNAYALKGVKSKSGKDTRMLAVSKGRFTWGGTPNDHEWAMHPDGRKVGIKVNVMLSRPVADIPQSDKEGPEGMSEMV